MTNERALAVGMPDDVVVIGGIVSLHTELGTHVFVVGNPTSQQAFYCAKVGAHTADNHRLLEHETQRDVNVQMPKDLPVRSGIACLITEESGIEIFPIAMPTDQEVFTAAHYAELETTTRLQSEILGAPAERAIDYVLEIVENTQGPEKAQELRERLEGGG